MIVILNRRQTVNPSLGDLKFPGSRGARGCGRQAAPSPSLVAQENKAAPYSPGGHPYGEGRRNRAKEPCSLSTGATPTHRHLYTSPPFGQREPICRGGEKATGRLGCLDGLEQDPGSCCFSRLAPWFTSDAPGHSPWEGWARRLLGSLSSSTSRPCLLPLPKPPPTTHVLLYIGSGL